MPPYVFGIAGWSKTGKTTLVERLVLEFCRRGLRVGTLKHDAHGFEADHPGKDTWRHQLAGAQATLIAGPDQLALFRRGPVPPAQELAGMLGAMDLVLAEGFKAAPWPKLEVYRSGGPMACAGDPWLVAVTGPEQPRPCPAPWYHWDEVEELANVIENARALGRAGRSPIHG